MRRLSAYAAIAACILGILALLYVAVAVEAFMWRNPKANSRTGWMHPIAVLTFARIPAYQE